MNDYPEGLITGELHKVFCEKHKIISIRMVRHYLSDLISSGLVSEEYLGLGHRGRTHLLRLVKQ